MAQDIITKLKENHRLRKKFKSHMEMRGKVLRNINHILSKGLISCKDHPQIYTKSKTQETLKH